MNDIVTKTKADFSRAKERIIKALATTPDDKINWSPFSTARTPVQLVAHAAMGNTLVQNLFTGKPFGYGSAAEYDAASRRLEKEYTTREQALSLLEQTSTAYLAWLDTLTPAQLAATVDTFFGPAEIASSINSAADHIRHHAAQIEYLQTAWGDTDWHL
jgi:uncharacterized damage-inducible protein DinB